MFDVREIEEEDKVPEQEQSNQFYFGFGRNHSNNNSKPNEFQKVD